MVTAVLQDYEICGKITFISRKRYYFNRMISVTKFATSQSHQPLYHQVQIIKV